MKQTLKSMCSFINYIAMMLQFAEIHKPALHQCNLICNKILLLLWLFLKKNGRFNFFLISIANSADSSFHIVLCKMCFFVVVVVGMTTGFETRVTKFKAINEWLYGADGKYWGHQIHCLYCIRMTVIVFHIDGNHTANIYGNLNPFDFVNVLFQIDSLNKCLIWAESLSLCDANWCNPLQNNNNNNSHCEIFPA